MYLVVAQKKAGTAPQSARRMGLISLVFSAIGVATFIIGIIVLLAVLYSGDVRQFASPSNLSKQLLFKFFAL